MEYFPQPGEKMRGFSRDMSQTRLVMYAGATWDWHQLHYDFDYAIKAKLSGSVVDGQMFGALFAEQIQDNWGPGTRIKSMELRFKSMVFAGERVGVIGDVVKAEQTDDGVLVTVDQIITAGARTCATAKSTALLPAQAADG